jgi:RNA polymerase primary sigma factor
MSDEEDEKKLLDGKTPEENDEETFDELFSPETEEEEEVPDETDYSEFTKSSDNAFACFMAEVNKRPKVTPEENLENLRQYRKTPTEELRNEIVEDNLRLVIHIASNFAHRTHTNIMDCIQEGSLGLLNAVEAFDTERGTAFSSIAVPYIKNAIRKYLTENKIIHIPPNIQTKMHKLEQANSALTQLYNQDPDPSKHHTPTDEELIAYLNDHLAAPNEHFSSKELAALRTYQNDIYSLDFVKTTDEGDDSKSLYEMIPDNSQDPASYSEIKAQKELLEAALASLEPREKDILLKREGDNGDNKTLQEIATIYGISPERVRQIEAEAFAKVKEYIRKHS